MTERLSGWVGIVRAIPRINSYLGVMGHFASRRLRRLMVGQHVRDWWKYAHKNGDVSKIVLRLDVGVSSVECRHVRTFSPRRSNVVSGEPSQLARR